MANLTETPGAAAEPGPPTELIVSPEPKKRAPWPVRLVAGFGIALIVIAIIILTMILVARYAMKNLPSFMKDFLEYFIGYGRGVGHIPECGTGHQNDAGLCYPECPSDYTGAGPVCWQDCPSGMTDVGVTCQKNSYGRGAGKIPKGCPSGHENDAGLCYPECKDDYKGVGPVCWQECPSGFTDYGVSCAKPKPYGRGAGYVSKSLCEKHHDDCEKWGWLWYPKCDDHYHNVACCICSPDCPSGMTDAGEFCTKNSYGRGAGKIPEACPSGHTNDAGLCYPECKSDYKGVGPVCWQDCPSGMTDTGGDCAKKTKTRGAGKIPKSCPSGQQNQAGLCYKDCKAGYKGAGPMCWAEWFPGGGILAGKRAREFDRPELHGFTQLPL